MSLLFISFHFFQSGTYKAVILGARSGVVSSDLLQSWERSAFVQSPLFYKGRKEEKCPHLPPMRRRRAAGVLPLQEVMEPCHFVSPAVVLSSWSRMKTNSALWVIYLTKDLGSVFEDRFKYKHPTHSAGTKQWLKPSSAIISQMWSLWLTTKTSPLSLGQWIWPWILHFKLKWWLRVSMQWQISFVMAFCVGECWGLLSCLTWPVSDSDLWHGNSAPGTLFIYNNISPFCPIKRKKLKTKKNPDSFLAEINTTCPWNKACP